MKYKVGDKVKIKSVKWFNQMLSIPSKIVGKDNFVSIECGAHIFTKEMCKFCGRVMTIQEIGIDFYLMEEDMLGYEFTDEMIEGLAEETLQSKFKINDRVETNDKLFGYVTDINYDVRTNSFMYYVSFIVDGGYYYESQLKLYEDIVVPSAEECAENIEDENTYNLAEVRTNNPAILSMAYYPKDEIYSYVLPKDYEFYAVYENELQLKKKKPKYPTTYEECCKVMGVNHTNDLDICEHCDYKTEITYYEDSILEKIEALYRLIICRDAYWKIAGEEMGLGKSWEPDWNDKKQDKHGFYNEIKNTIINSKVFVFPTAKMRDAFYEAFKELIEECKELL